MRFPPAPASPLLAAAAALALSLAAPVRAAFDQPALPGAAAADGWAGLHNGNYDPLDGYGNGHPGTAAWTSTIAANFAGSDAGGVLGKVSGSGYPASQGIYTGFTGGTFRVTESAALAGMETVVFQTGMGTGTTGDVVGSPLLHVNGNPTGLVPDTSLLRGSAPANIAGNDVTINYRLFQWDLRGVVDPITSYHVQWTTAPHAQIYELQLDEGDTFAAVPEPGALGLGCGAAAAALLTRRRRPADATRV